MRNPLHAILLTGALLAPPAAGASPASPGAPAPAPAGAEASLLDGLARARAARERRPVSVTADVVIELASRTWKGAGTCEGRLAARRPGALRLVGYAAVATVFDAATDGARFQVVVPPSGATWVGRAQDESLLVGLPILPDDVVAALFGEPYGAPAGPRRVLEGGTHPWIAWTLADGHEVRTRFDAARWLPTRAELWRDGRAEARLDYHDYRRRQGVWWPGRIDFDWPEEGGRLALTFDHVRFDPPLVDSLFTPRPPAGLRVIEVAPESAEAGEAP